MMDIIIQFIIIISEAVTKRYVLAHQVTAFPREDMLKMETQFRGFGMIMLAVLI